MRTSLVLAAFAGIGALALLSSAAFALQIPQGGWLFDGRDGPARAAAGPYDATTDDEDLRFWIGQGLALAHIRMSDRERQFLEEEGQPYTNSIICARLDESSTDPNDHRLVVLTAHQPKTSPPRPATLYLLDASIPETPFELDRVELVETLSNGYEYLANDVQLIPGTNVIVVLGTTSDMALPPLTKPLILMYRREIVQPSGTEQLVKIAEIVQEPIALENVCDSMGVTGRKFASIQRGTIHEIDGTTLVFAVGSIDITRSLNGVAVAKLDPDASLEADRVQWYTATTHIWDPVHWGRCVKLWHGTYVPPLLTLHANWTTVAVESGTPDRHWLYVAGAENTLVTEFEVTDFVASGFGTPNPIDVPTETQVWWILAHHDATNDVDLIFTLGIQWLNAFKRTAPEEQHGTVDQSFGDLPPDALIVKQDLGLGPREYLWTVALEKPWSWSAFDVTDRPLVPGVEPPTRIFGSYAPGGTDGAVWVPAWGRAFSTNFAGIIAWDVAVDLENGSATALPDYDSYQPASHHSYDAVCEQLDLAHFGGDEWWLVASNGAGGAFLWAIDPLTKSPEPGLHFWPQWSNWEEHPLPEGSNTYSERATFAYSPARDRHFLLIDYAKTTGTNEARLGRFTQTPQSLVFADGTWEEVDLLSGDTENRLKWLVSEVSVSPDARWAFCGMQNGFVVVQLHDDQGDAVFEVVETVYTGGGTSLTDPFGTGRDYLSIAGIASYGDYLVVNAGHADTDSTEPGAIVLLAFDSTTGQVGNSPLVVHQGDVEDVPGPAGEMDGVPFRASGPVRIHEVEPGVARVYAGSLGIGTVVEFEHDVRGASPPLVPPTFVPLAWWHNDTHFTSISDVRPYDVGDPSGLPVVLVGRYHQTIGFVGATGLVEEE